jgi:hypothetical protein
MGLFTKLGKLYRETAVMVLSTLLLLVAFWIFAYAYYAIRGRTKPPLYSALLRPKALRRSTESEARTFFLEFDRMGREETYIYAPWVGFSEREFHGNRLNVDAAVPLPMRRTLRPQAGGGTREFIICAFGGSTMFGWGVPDEETIPSHLARVLSHARPDLAIQVLNYGHSYFFSSQELVLFQTLLRRGNRCDVAVFLDGLNDSFRYSVEDTPAFNDRMAMAFEKEQHQNPTSNSYIAVSQDFPPVKFLRAVGRRLGMGEKTEPANYPEFDSVAKYKLNASTADAIGKLNGTSTLFFWQPVPAGPDYTEARDLAAKIRQSVQMDNFHFIADIFNEADADEIYVDQHHYGDTASERLARIIADEILKLPGMSN